MKWFIAVLLAGCGTVANDKHDAAVHDSPTGDSRGVDSRGIDAFTCAATPSNLQGRWHAESNLNDDSGNGYSGTAVGTLSYTTGKHGMAFLLDGSTNEIQVSEGDALWPAGSFSVEAWLKTTSTSSVIIAQKYQCANSCPAGSFALISLHINNGNPLFDLRADNSGGTTSSIVDATHNVADSNWHHLVGVRDAPGAMMYLYVDGGLGGSLALPTGNTGAMTNTDSETDPFTIGGGIVGGTSTLTNLFPGAIDDVGFYKSALSATQIAQIYAAPEGECP